ncbi:MAG: GHKL domain-containing protein, partial [candidate division Zixibacteria bacterium]|nr:GHKL domain-containing protein [candidate division Zixibacteria bacterium]
ILLSGAGKFSIGRIEKKSFRDLVSVFYHTNQIYILMTLSGFFVGLIVINYYRSRTKSNLKTISIQKTELEETHQKLKEAQVIILAQEKYRQARDIAGGFAHEIRNALSPARNALSKLTSNDITIAKDVSRVQKLTRFTDSAIERAIKMTKAISQYTKIEEMRQPGEVILLKVIDKAIEINYHRIEDQNIRINTAIDDACKVLGNEEQLLIVFNNLLINSLDALTGTAQPSILVKSHTNEQYEVVEFRDNGSGIDRDSLERIFDVFYSTKPDRGTGIGLTMAKKIIEIYGGSITAESIPGEFTSFKILIRRIQNQKENID